MLACIFHYLDSLIDGFVNLFANTINLVLTPCWLHVKGWGIKIRKEEMCSTVGGIILFKEAYPCHPTPHLPPDD